MPKSGGYPALSTCIVCVPKLSRVQPLAVGVPSLESQESKKILSVAVQYPISQFLNGFCRRKLWLLCCPHFSLPPNTLHPVHMCHRQNNPSNWESRPDQKFAHISRRASMAGIRGQQARTPLDHAQISKSSVDNQLHCRRWWPYRSKDGGNICCVVARN